jgi:hypothetical protein
MNQKQREYKKNFKENQNSKLFYNKVFTPTRFKVGSKVGSLSNTLTKIYMFLLIGADNLRVFTFSINLYFLSSFSLSLASIFIRPVHWIYSLLWWGKVE